MFWSCRIQQRLKERKEQKFAEEKKVHVMLDYRDAILSEKICFQIFSVHTKTESREIQIPSVWKAF